MKNASCLTSIIIRNSQKIIKEINPKWNQSWIFIRRTDAEAETSILWPPDANSWLTGRDPDAGKDGWQEEKWMTEDKMASLIQWTWVWSNSGRLWGTGKPGVLQSMGSQRVGHNWATEQQQWKKYTLRFYLLQKRIDTRLPNECNLFNEEIKTRPFNKHF